MAKPEKRWQLLLVADDGRIIPFKRVKGIAVTLTILLVLLGLACAGLGWQLTALKVRHRKALDQLADANRQAAHHKSERELITAELVLAEARMEKAGLLVAKPQSRDSQPKPLKTTDIVSASDIAIDGGAKGPASAATTSPTAVQQPTVPPAATPVANVSSKTVPEDAPAESTATPQQPAVALGDLELKHDTGNQLLLARFQVKNTGPRSSPVAGRCVVVLKNDPLDPEAWLAMPGVSLVNGKPDGERGQPFKISRFREMKIEAMGPKDPSAFKTATVYVFDSTGAALLEQDFSVALPAPKKKSQPVTTPADPAPAAPPKIEAPSLPMKAPQANLPADQRTPDEGSGEATGNRPEAKPLDADAGTAAQPAPTYLPTDGPSPNESVEPVKKEDTRSRF